MSRVLLQQAISQPLSKQRVAAGCLELLQLDYRRVCVCWADFLPRCARVLSSSLLYLQTVTAMHNRQTRVIVFMTRACNYQGVNTGESAQRVRVQVMVLWKRLDWPTGAARCRGAWCKIARFIFGLLLGVIIGCSMSLTYSINLQQPVRAGYDCPRAEQTAPVQLKVRVFNFAFLNQLILSCAHQQNHIPMCMLLP